MAVHLIGESQLDGAVAYLDYTDGDFGSWQNGLLWSEFIESAYQDSRICFQWEPLHSTFRMHLLDEGLRHTLCSNLMRTYLRSLFRGVHNIEGD